MVKTYSIATVDGLTTIRFRVKPKMEDVIEAIDDVAENHVTTLRLWDVSKGLDLTSDQLRDLAEYGLSKKLPVSRVATIAPSDLAYGLLRMFAVFREDGLSDHQIFRDEQQARDWLLEKSP